MSQHQYTEAEKYQCEMPSNKHFAACVKQYNTHAKDVMTKKDMQDWKARVVARGSE